ncbi:hypothetical protein UlMin_005346 [Ulmus minor]
MIGPIFGQKYSEIIFPIISPYPTTKKDIHFLKYWIYVDENRGRGQIYPDGNKSNNNIYNATTAIPELLVSNGESIKLDQLLTSNLNVGGFDPLYVQSLLLFLASVILPQIFLVLKKK